MINDTYAMNINTGEILPCTVAIREYYKTHGYMDAWTTEWQDTGLPVDDIYIDLPDFTAAVKG